MAPLSVWSRSFWQLAFLAVEERNEGSEREQSSQRNLPRGLVDPLFVHKVKEVYDSLACPIDKDRDLPKDRTGPLFFQEVEGGPKRS